MLCFPFSLIRSSRAYSGRSRPTAGPSSPRLCTANCGMPTRESARKQVGALFLMPAVFMPITSVSDPPNYSILMEGGEEVDWS
jgi:hypothetical protein